MYLTVEKEIKKKYPTTVFHICGFYEDENYRDEIESLQRQGIVEYHGNVTDIREIHRITQCTIHPSFYPEGVSNVLLETAASGRAIITTNRPGCKDVVDDGINGYIVEEKNTNALREATERFIHLSRDQRIQMGMAGRKKVEKEYSRDIVVNSYLKAIQKAVRR